MVYIVLNTNKKELPVEELKSKYLSFADNIISLSKTYGVSPSTIRNRLVKEGVIIRGSRKYTFNDLKFFSRLNCDDAYWLGFIFADGNVYKDTLSIKLGLVDYTHLVKFKEYLDYSGEVEITQKYCRVRVYSPKICESLKQYNVLPNKTHNLIFPSLNLKLYPHFIRGFFDGDGWVSKNQVCFSSCSLPFISDLKKQINKGIGRDVGCIVKVDRESNKVPNYTLSFDGRVSGRQVQDYMIGNSTLMLQRKHKLDS